MAKHFVMGIVTVALCSYAADGSKKRNHGDLLGRNSPAQSPHHSPGPSHSPAGSPALGVGRGRAPSFSSGIRFSSSLSPSSSSDALSSRSSGSLSASSGASSQASSVASTPSDPDVRPSMPWPAESGDAQMAKRHKISLGSESDATTSPSAGVVMPREPLHIVPRDSESMAIDQESQSLLLLPSQTVDEGSPTVTLAEPLQQLNIHAKLASLRTIDSAATLSAQARTERKKERIVGKDSSSSDEDSVQLPDAAVRPKGPIAAKDSFSSEEDTDLHGAAEQGDVDLVKSLISSKVDINALNRDGDTPLHAAVKNATGKESFHTIIATLIQAKADVHLRNHDKQTALDIATMCIHDPIIIELLQKAAASGGGAGLV